jgi:hypothetical protein
MAYRLLQSALTVPDAAQVFRHVAGRSGHHAVHGTVFDLRSHEPLWEFPGPARAGRAADIRRLYNGRGGSNGSLRQGGWTREAVAAIRPRPGGIGSTRLVSGCDVVSRVGGLHQGALRPQYDPPTLDAISLTIDIS